MPLETPVTNQLLMTTLSRPFSSTVGMPPPVGWQLAPGRQILEEFGRHDQFRGNPK
jgi:hypothetical protein